MSMIEGTPANKALISRVKLILTRPTSEWDVIDAEAATTKGLYTGYACILAAISPICTFIGSVAFGYGGFGVTYRPNILSALVTAIVTYVLSLAMVFVLALIIDALAPTFDGQKNQIQALKVSVYASTAGWVAGVFHILPQLSLLAVLGGLYSLYLLFLGLPKLMKSPQEKALAYTGVTILAAIVLSIVVAAVASAGIVGGTLI